MDKKFYETPEMEIIEMELRRDVMLVTSGDPEFDSEPSDE